jgi:hypothetical protein
MEETMGEEKKVFKIEKVEKLDTPQINQVDPTQLIDQTQQIDASKTKFDLALARADNNWVENQSKVQTTQITEPTKARPSPIEELNMSSNKIQRLGPVSVDKLIAQAEDIKTNLSAPVKQLQETINNNSSAKLNPAYQNELSQRLVHIDTSLQSALRVSGAEVTTHAVQANKQQPLVSFLNYLTRGDSQITGLLKEIQATQAKDQGRISPANLLAIQIKLTFVQQQLEFFTNVLNKAVEATKTIMNVQV